MSHITTATLITLGFLTWTTAAAQQATEVYIPIGESPGISGKESIIGSISDIEYEQQRMMVSTGGASRSVRITPQTRFYLDRSDNQKRSVAGSFDDCREGRRVEAYVDDNGKAIWIKIAVS